MPKKDKFERLLDLIQYGKTPAIKKAAASQIGKLQAEFAYDLSTLLHKLYPLLMHHDFECRRAAASALESLISECRQERMIWQTGRPLMKLSQFDLSRIISKASSSKPPGFLTHNQTQHMKAADDYKDEVFSISPESKVAELCEISERMINKLNSPNWFYRHGAVLCLLATINPRCPRDYIEDLSVRLLNLIALDRFKDFSMDVVKVPVVDPACHLLARCFMQNIEESIPILEQFHSYHEDDDNSQDDGWSLRFAFWTIIQHMLMIDKKCLDPAWIQKMFFETIKNKSDDSDEEVVAASIETINLIIPLLPNPNQTASRIYLDIFSEAEELTSANTASTQSLDLFIKEANITDFIDEDTFDLVFNHCSFPNSSTREALYNFICTLLDHHDLEIYEDLDFLDFAKKLFVFIVNEPSQELFTKSINMITCLNNLMEEKDLFFNEKYCIEIMEVLSAEMSKDVKKITRIMPVVIELSKIAQINEESPVFSNCKSFWCIVLLLILCLNLNTKMPVFTGVSNNNFTRDPISTLISLFQLDKDKVIDMIPRIAEIRISALRLFISKYVGRMLKDYLYDDVINQLIQMNADYEIQMIKHFSESLKENSDDSPNLHFSYQQALKSSPRPPKIDVAQTIAINAVYKPPIKLDEIFDILQLLYCVMSKMTLNSQTIIMIVKTMMRIDQQKASMLAYVSDLYAKFKPSVFLSHFIRQIENKRNLPFGPIEFIDLFLTDFDTTKLDLLSWASFFVSPALQNFASQDETIRRMSAHSLAQIVRILPLDNGDCKSLPKEMHELKAKSMEYLMPLFDITKSPEYILDPPPNFSFMGNNAGIRHYQRDGINWLGFLFKYGLNGILADDMGLGKTFQCLCAVSNAHTQEIESIISGTNPEFRSSQTKPLSLVLCPPSVITHWCREVNNFFPHLRVTAVFQKSESLSTSQINNLDGILVTSYNIAKSCNSMVSSRVFTYCVLDEGHIIKNKSSNTAKAVMTIRARHRLILSGTPIQNNVTELWNLMDFLMPGFLGDRKAFNEKYERYIKKMFKPDASEKDTEKGQECLQSLHNQVLPFIMRRLRSVVLNELPDCVYFYQECLMTPLQKQLFNQLRATNTLPDGTEIDEHVFTKMKKERDLCIHPCLIDPQIHPVIEYSAKLKELKKVLLTQIGLGGGKEAMKNRALLFAQSSQTIDTVIKIVLKDLSGITYDIFDGRVPERERAAVLDRFNRDDGPDLLLLTTSIGGLGLNLQVANNVIFLENSWNFTEDDQAIARSHRMGQKRTVTVFNLITKGTIEERIIEKQRLKRQMVSTIINDDNAQNQTDMTMIQDQLYADEQHDNNQSSNAKMTKQEIIKESEKLVTNPEQYINDYKNDDVWASERK